MFSTTHLWVAIRSVRNIVLHDTNNVALYAVNNVLHTVNNVTLHTVNNVLHALNNVALHAASKLCTGHRDLNSGLHILPSFGVQIWKSL